MLSKLFRPKWQHENPEIRKTALLKLNGSDQSILKTIVANDTDSSVRMLALSNITDTSTLQQLAHNAKTSAEQEFALKIWVTQLCGNGQKSSVEAEQWIIDCTDEKLLGGIIAFAENDTIRELAIAGIRNDDQLLNILRSSKNSSVWLMVIDKLNNEHSLKAANAIIEGRDKKSQQAIKKKLEAIKQAETELKNIRDQITALTTKLQHLVNHANNPLFEGILMACEQQRLTLDAQLDASQASIIDALIAQGKTILANAQPAIETQIETIPEEAQLDPSAEILDNVDNIIHQSDSLTMDEIESSLTTLTHQWHNLASNNKNEKEFSKRTAILNTLIAAKKWLETQEAGTANKQKTNKMLDEWHQQLRQYPSPACKSFADNIQQAINNLTALHAAQAQQIKNWQHEIEQQLTLCEEYIDKKQLNNAQKHYDKAKNTITQLNKHDTKNYPATLQRLFLAIKNLQDWKNFAGDEKRLQLIIKMKNLIDDNSDLEKKAEFIKHLQSEWKSLGHCQNKSLWDEFKSYADLAYAPCQDFFNQQKQIRQFNAEQRNIICSQIEQFLSEQNWNEVDWKSIEKLENSIHTEWNKFSPVSREQHQPLQDRFYASIHQLKEKMNAERTANNNKMLDLINKAQKLLESDDTSKAITEYSSLQQAWKAIGISFRKEQQENWKNFKALGDALYEKRQNQRQEADQDRQNNLENAKRIISSIQTLCSTNDTELSQNKPAYENAKQEFKTLGGLPKEHFKSIMADFQKACDSFDHALSGIAARSKAQQLTTLESLANEWLTQEINGETACLPENHKLPEKWIKALNPRFHSQKPDDNALENAIIVCLEMESLAGIPTPAEDQALKMQWQISQLSKNFGHLKQTSIENSLEELYLKWYAQPCWNKEEYPLLQTRFISAAKKLST